MSELKPCPLCRHTVVSAINCDGCTSEPDTACCEKCGCQAPICEWQAPRPAENRIKAQGYYDSCIDAGCNSRQAQMLADIYANNLKGEG